jgi:heterodisulfide reductase subunit A
MPQQPIRTDALVIGGGIAGLQAALDLADQGYRTLIVEKEPSIGGKMIALSKVFPTLDCSSCICTPRMAAAAHHDNITILTYCEVQQVDRDGEGFAVRVLRKPRYVDERCEKECPTGAIDFLQEPEEVVVETGTIIITTGYQMTAMEAKPEYGLGHLCNVLSPLAVERLLAPHGPYGRVLRPSDGKVPDMVAYVQCAGSRDRSLGVPYCSRVCCMYAIKQAMLLAGALPLVEITIYYMDIRAFGKGFEQFYQNAKAMGIEFVKAKVAKITEDEQQNPVLRIEMIEEDGRVEERTHDMVVLSLGIVPEWKGNGALTAASAEDGFFHTPEPKLAPCRTDQEGVFAAGTATGPKDIPDSIVEAGAAALEAAAYLRRTRPSSGHDQSRRGESAQDTVVHAS